MLRGKPKKNAVQPSNYTTSRTGPGTAECGRARGRPTTDVRPHDVDGVDVVVAVLHDSSTSIITSVSSGAFFVFCAGGGGGGGHGTPGAGISPRSQRARRAARPSSIQGPALESTQPPRAGSQVHVPPRAVGRFSGFMRSLRMVWCWSIPSTEIFSSVRGESHGLTMVHMAVKDAGAFMTSI